MSLCNHSLPPANEGAGRLCFYTWLWFCSQRGWGWYPSMHCRSTGPHPEGSCGVWLGGMVSRPTTGGKFRNLVWGVLQAHNQGVSRPTPGGSPGQHPGDLQTHTWVVSRPTLGCLQAHTWGIPACTEADTPQQMATAAGSMHPTGMHSCLV